MNIHKNIHKDILIICLDYNNIIILNRGYVNRYFYYICGIFYFLIRNNFIF